MRVRAALPPPVEPGAVVASLHDVTVERGGRAVLRAVSLAVRAGELLAVVGPNGAGKSTVLAVLAGDLSPASGEVLVHGRAVGAWSPAELAMRRSVLPQQAQVAFPFRAVDVVRMGRAPWRGTAAEADDDEAVAAALATVDGDALAWRPVTALSGGEQARIALARVVAQRADLVLLDEPTAALDLRHAETTMTHARRLSRGGAAVVAVLHELNLAAAYADRIALVADGRLAAVGPPAEVLVPGLLAEVYGHPVDVITHPATGAPLVVPRRG